MLGVASSPRCLFLSSLGAIYCAAFLSYWLQYPGLLGSDGLLPASSFWVRVRQGGRGGGATVWERFCSYPSLLWLVDDEQLVDVALEGLAALGALLGALAAGGLHHSSCFLVMWLSYLTLYSVGQQWLSFQWDLLLLETGFAAILYAPSFSLGTPRARPAAAHPMTWVLRTQWVKFMVCSGAVKVTADCPTWKSLTALEYHFASTCLPTAEAWLHHSLPPFLLRLATAIMFLCELVAPWLLLAPITPVRRLGVLVQLPLQAAIMLSGNYNWFNLHTAALLLPAWEHDFGLDSGPSGAPGTGGLLLAPLRAWESLWATRLGRATGYLGALGGLIWAQLAYFPVTYTPPPAAAPSPWPWAALAEALWRDDALDIRNRFDSARVHALLGAALQNIPYLYAVALVGAVAHAAGATSAPPPPHAAAAAPLPAGRARRALRLLLRSVAAGWCLVLGLASLLLLGVTLLPLSDLAHRDVAPLLPPLLPGLREGTQRASRALAPFHASNSYGLFRRMTGVGRPPPGAAAGGRAGWGHRPPSIVKVPAVVVEASNDGGHSWHEVPFRYAPFRPERAPRRTAPHQPRLDWQMWFAALGSYQQNAWLLHLLYKLTLPGDPAASAALQLLDLDAYPFRHGPPPSLVKATLYHYDFTRVTSPWALRTPGAPLQAANCSAFGPYFEPVSYEPLSSGAAAFACHHWWSRSPVGEYVPVVDGATLRAQVVEKQGWPTALSAARGDECKRAHSGAQRRACVVVVRLRRAAAPLRAWVGVTVRVRGVPFFFDGPMLLITAAMLATPLARVAGGAARRRGRWSARPETETAAAARR